MVFTARLEMLHSASRGKFEPRHEKPAFGFPTLSDTYQAVQLKKMARGLEISDLESRGIVLSK